MGCCMSEAKREIAVRQELGHGHLTAFSNKVPPDTLVVVIRVRALTDLLPSANYTGSSGPYVELSLSPGDAAAGEQLQRTSYKPGTSNPRWEPAEKFTFIVQDSQDSKIRFSVFSFNPVRNPDRLGDAILSLKTVGISEREVKKVPLINPNDGKRQGQIEFELETSTIKKALSIQEHVIMEYQRWQPVKEWAHDNLLPTDPGRWCDVTGKIFDKNMEGVAPKVPHNWTVTRSWYTQATEDPDGWQYGGDFTAIAWFKRQQPRLVVRRRVWVREISGPFEDAGATSNPLNEPIIHP